MSNRFAGNEDALVAVIGCTGTGKSQLAVELAQHVEQQQQQRWRSQKEGTAAAGYGKAEIISADSMQVYRGLDVITNKASEAEMGGVKHHLMSFLSPGEEYTIKDFLMQANALIAEMHEPSSPSSTAEAARPTLPIIAGGTSYYVQHLLFPGRLMSADQHDDAYSKDDANKLTSITTQSLSPKAAEVASTLLPNSLHTTWTRFLGDEGIHIPGHGTADPQDGQESTTRGPSQRIDDVGGPATLSSPQLWNLLHALDPPMAARWHPNDQRKVRRSLVVFATTGKPHSVWLEEQRLSEKQATSLSTTVEGVFDHGQSREHSSDQDQEVRLTAPQSQDKARESRRRRLLFWVWCEPETLKTRLNRRIHKMIEGGLLDEIRELRAIAKALYESGSPDYTRGIFQAIGFKEFDAFLTYMDQQTEARLSDAQQLDAESRKLFDAAVESMQRATRQYARRQTSWIRNQLLVEVHRAKEASQARKRREDISVAEFRNADAGSPTGADGHDCDVEIYLLDATDLSRWEDNVAKVAKDILEKFLDAQQLPDPLTVTPSAAEHLQKAIPGAQPPQPDSLDSKAFVTCPVCSSVATAHEPRRGPASSSEADDDDDDDDERHGDLMQQVAVQSDRSPLLIRVTEMEKHKQSRRHRMAVKKMNKRKYEAGKKAEAEARRQQQQQQQQQQSQQELEENEMEAQAGEKIS
ncbi:Leucyl aminopeptidase yscIV [Tilletia horrida]|uniref:Leucyl aminopeptidase yscIV n=1 Tax=Tilletia horrida TaxID=155126 RepID=A0AAN6GQI3_9BASI|nr:Leucyl aminopeptidase yscIV [Tilletia horrida]KAK0553326.1 Leucyl aminopeptidase yscIV [Tilletia horrida]KAK0567711.1 Leucyl aminopeptidase yscIV [Tilletia horrida]